MFYLALAFSLVWACHLAYLFALDRRMRRLGQRLDARAAISRSEA